MHRLETAHQTYFNLTYLSSLLCLNIAFQEFCPDPFYLGLRGFMTWSDLNHPCCPPLTIIMQNICDSELWNSNFPYNTRSSFWQKLKIYQKRKLKVGYRNFGDDWFRVRELEQWFYYKWAPYTLVSAPQLNIGSYAIMIGRIIFQSSVVKVETKYLMQFFIIIIFGLSQPRLNPSHINFIRYLLELIHIL